MARNKVKDNIKEDANTEVLQEESTNDVVESKTEDTKQASTEKTSNKYQYIIKNKTARREQKSKKALIAVAIFLGVLLLLGGTIYGFYSATEVNKFNLYATQTGNKILSLAETSDFSTESQVLEISGPEHMDNTSLFDTILIGDTPISQQLLKIAFSDGYSVESNSKFIASTFYLRNNTTDLQHYAEILNIKSFSGNIDGALRVMLVRNYDIEVYGKVNSDGSQTKVVPTKKDYGKLYIRETYDANEQNVKLIAQDDEGHAIVQSTEGAWLAEPFYSSPQDEAYFIFYNDGENQEGREIGAGEVIKYSIIMWLEGWDSDCKDKIINDSIRIEFSFETI